VGHRQRIWEFHGPLDSSFTGPCLDWWGTQAEDCSVYTDPEYTLIHQDNFGHGCIVAGQVFRGNQESPLYGAIIFADMTGDNIFAYKQGDTEASVIGTVRAISNQEFRNGVVHIAQNYRGELYAVFLNMYGDQHIYKLAYLDNPDHLGPGEIPISVAYDPLTELKASGKYELWVHNVRGDLVLKTKGFNHFQTEIDALNKTGIYFVKVSSNAGIFTKRILVGDIGSNVMIK